MRSRFREGPPVYSTPSDRSRRKAGPGSASPPAGSRGSWAGSDVLLPSPRARARETAGIAARAIRHVEPVIEPALGGEGVEAIVTALAGHPPDATVALVGHEPMLGALLAQLVGSTDAARFGFSKGGAALVDLPDGLAGRGRLVWFLPPRVLRALAPPVEIMPAAPIENGQAARTGRTHP